MSKSVSHFIDFFRWTGALLIVLLHAGNIFVNNGDIMKVPHNVFEYVWWFFITYGFGRQALMMFFVFSGVLVGGTVLLRMKRGDAFFRKYIIDRLVRIYVVLIPVVLIGFVLDEVGRRTFAGYGVYEIFPGHYDPTLMIWSLFSLQGIWKPPYGTNEALWSLGVECWYYVVFPLLFMPLAIAYSVGRRWSAVVAGISIFLFLGYLGWPASYFVLGFMPWLIGAGVTVLKRPLIRSRRISLAILVVGVSVMRLAIPGNQFDMYPTKIFTDGASALLAGNLILTLRFDESEGFRFSRWKIHKFLADFSYSLYALHVPILFFMWAVTEWAIRPHWRSEPATFSHYAMAIFASAFVMVCAYYFSLVTEKKTDAVRRAALRVVPGGGDRQPAAIASGAS